MSRPARATCLRHPRLPPAQRLDQARRECFAIRSTFAHARGHPTQGFFFFLPFPLAPTLLQLYIGVARGTCCVGANICGLLRRNTFSATRRNCYMQSLDRAGDAPQFMLQKPNPSRLSQGATLSLWSSSQPSWGPVTSAAEHGCRFALRVRPASLHDLRPLTKSVIKVQAPATWAAQDRLRRRTWRSRLQVWICPKPFFLLSDKATSRQVNPAPQLRIPLIKFLGFPSLVERKTLQGLTVHPLVGIAGGESASIKSCTKKRWTWGWHPSSSKSKHYSQSRILVQPRASVVAREWTRLPCLSSIRRGPSAGNVSQRNPPNGPTPSKLEESH